jgi:hypothetical protein
MAMTEDPIIIQMNIAHYRAMLHVGMDGERLAVIKRLLAKAQEDLVMATCLKRQQ